MVSKPSRRERQAQETRRDIVQAGRRLFAAHGYSATSVAQIASEAGVSVQTIYDSVGSKAAILRELNDLIDEEANVMDIAGRLFTSNDPREVVTLATLIGTTICSRSGDIMRATIAASRLDEDLGAVYGESMRRHRAGIRGTVARLAALDALRPGVEPEYATQVMAGITEPPVTFTFVDNYGWSYEQWHSWVVDTICGLLLKPEYGGTQPASE